MKISSFNYLTKEGIKNVWTNRLMSLSSIGVLVACMVLIGMALLVSFNGREAIGSMNEENVILVAFDDYNSALYGDKERQPVDGEEPDENGISDGMYTVHNQEDIEKVLTDLENLDNVAKVEYVSKEQALETVKSTLPESDVDYFSILEADGENPMSDGALITVKDIAGFEETVEAIKNVNGVDAVRSDRETAKKVEKLGTGLAIAGIAIVAILLIIAFVIVSNTIRVTMYNRKLEIGIMKAVGATDSFVRIPFVVEGILIGIISAVLSMGVLYCCYRIIGEAIVDLEFQLVPFMSKIWLIAGVFFGIGIVAGAVGSMVMIRKYLKKEGSEFAAI